MKSKVSPQGRVRRHKVNKLGRDFIVGDIHGAYEMLARGMRAVRFNPRVDRLFSVGDLIDRGPQSLRALDFLNQPWFHAVRGNHDDDFERLGAAQIRQLAAEDWNGLGWAAGLDDAGIERLKERFKRLPIAMEIDTRRGSVGLVHADVPAGMAWDRFLEGVEAGDESCLQTALWGRERIQKNDASGVSGIGRVFVGHTIQWAGPKRLGNVYAIDTGAVFHELGAEMGSLTMVNLMCCSQVVSAPTAPAARIDGVWTHEQAAAGPFGAYAVGALVSKKPGL